MVLSRWFGGVDHLDLEAQLNGWLEQQKLGKHNLIDVKVVPGGSPGYEHIRRCKE